MDDNKKQLLNENSNDESSVSISKNNNRSSKLLAKKIINYINSVILGIIIVIIAILVFFLVKSKVSGLPPSVAGYQLYTVISGSMSPQIGVGAVVLTKPINPDNLKEGDIITFRGQSADLMMTTHRILKININENGIDFTTKGDANNVKDPNTVKPERVVGKVYGKIEYLGYLLVFAQSKKGLLTMVFIPGILIIGYELYNINKLIKESKANKKV